MRGSTVRPPPFPARRSAGRNAGDKDVNGILSVVAIVLILLLLVALLLPLS